MALNRPFDHLVVHRESVKPQKRSASQRLKTAPSVVLQRQATPGPFERANGVDGMQVWIDTAAETLNSSASAEQHSSAGHVFDDVGAGGHQCQCTPIGDRRVGGLTAPARSRGSQLPPAALAGQVTTAGPPGRPPMQGALENKEREQVGACMWVRMCVCACACACVCVCVRVSVCV